MLNRQNSPRAVEGLAAWLPGCGRRCCEYQQQPTSAAPTVAPLHEATRCTGVSEGQEGESARATGASGLQHLMYMGGSRELLVPDRACH